MDFLLTLALQILA